MNWENCYLKETTKRAQIRTKYRTQKVQLGKKAGVTLIIAPRLGMWGLSLVWRGYILVGMKYVTETLNGPNGIRPFFETFTCDSHKNKSDKDKSDFLKCGSVWSWPRIFSLSFKLDIIYTAYNRIKIWPRLGVPELLLKFYLEQKLGQMKYRSHRNYRNLCNFLFLQEYHGRALWKGY